MFRERRQAGFPRLLPATTYTAKRGAEISINASWTVLDKPHKVAIAKRNAFILIIDPRSLESFIDLPYAWQMTHSINNIKSHVAGIELNNQGPDQHRYFSSFSTSQCNEYGYCVSILSNIKIFLSHNLFFVGFIILFAYICGWLGYVRIRRYLHHRRSIEYRVRRGIKTASFYPVVQPVVELSSQRVVGCEVLARFRDKKGELYPDQFIPVVAAQGLSWPFTLSLIDQALEDLKANGLQDQISVAFNFMPRDVTNGKILELLQHPKVTTWTGKLTIELTESEEFEGSEAHQVLYKLSQAGFTIAIDDFGTGYSNLKYIDQLHCSYLKIDRTFVMDVEDGAIRSSIIPHIVSIAEKANLKVIAEGVENLAQATELHRMGVKYVQGYFYGRPMPIKQLAEKIDG